MQFSSYFGHLLIVQIVSTILEFKFTGKSLFSMSYRFCLKTVDRVAFDKDNRGGHIP